MKLWVDIKVGILLNFNICFAKKTRAVINLGFRINYSGFCYCKRLKSLIFPEQKPDRFFDSS